VRVVGIIGGMSAESTAVYYTAINAGVRERLGGVHSAELLVWSVDFAPIADMQASGRWDRAADVLVDIARRLERAGAEAIVLASNTMHKVAAPIEAAVTIPLIHIADVTGHAVRASGASRPGLIATAFTMEQDFLVGRLRDRFGIDVIVPDAYERARIHEVIYAELCRGIVTETSRREFVDIASRLVDRGADGLLLACTEVGMLLDSTSVAVPVFDTVDIHAAAAVDFAVGRTATAAGAG
jgi:aspartate racemase